MSQRNGDKSRFNRLRKTNLRMREHIREFRKAIQGGTAGGVQKKESTKKGA